MISKKSNNNNTLTDMQLQTNKKLVCQKADEKIKK